MSPQKAEEMLQRHAPGLAKLGRELATNFDIPSRDLIQMHCNSMGISEKQWREIKNYEIQKEQGPQREDRQL